MVDVSTLIDRLEMLQEGSPLPGDDTPIPVFGTQARVRENKAAIRMISWANHNPLPPRLACELVDNLDTILAALRFWKASVAANASPQPGKVEV